ncbi:MAG: HAD hydrolase-like protein [Bacteroidales bacterium]|nr:HAD hydrolase-like protein [Bacteroidales bacterium]
MTTLKLIILDFDGTLADTRELIVHTHQEAMCRMNHPVVDEAAIVSTIGLPLREGIHIMCPDVVPEDLPAWVKTYRMVFDRLKNQIVPAIFPSIRETLAFLTGKGYKCTVASSRGAESLNAFLKAMRLAPYISYVLGADDVTHAKPHPEPVLKTLRDSACQPTEALVVGDMPVDIQRV